MSLLNGLYVPIAMHYHNVCESCNDNFNNKRRYDERRYDEFKDMFKDSYSRTRSRTRNYKAMDQDNKNLLSMTRTMTDITGKLRIHIHEIGIHGAKCMMVADRRNQSINQLIIGLLTRSFAIIKRTARRSCLVDLVHCQHCFLRHIGLYGLDIPDCSNWCLSRAHRSSIGHISAF